MKDRKLFKNLEKTVKGFSNHRRIEILYLLKRKSEMSILDISEELKVDFRNVSSHVQKLEVSGLVMKRHDGPSVRHKLTKRGVDVLMFLGTLE